ncbi:ribonuclease E inhibitor RraB [Actinoallomurus iriomotensis]|uniref:Regulator of ribonuclease activity B domain-containing protein n=1 Tax=Actinoallomurus iriomotensis TaxID=478107 RepID=A0A9W6S990_9ACTN|nr:ribonuclease E inhibitor RraB [Actinoallomurus iriomotensis]GLY88172.1 hypothetical protein Airi02_061010 [Actinoallomurus iriomotensis]
MADDEGFTTRGRLQRDRAMMAGRDMSSPVGVTHFFSVNAPGARPVVAEAALVDLGVRDIVADEELTGDGHWHLAAFDSLLLSPETILRREEQMHHLAWATDVRYDGWKVTLTAGEERVLSARREQDPPT